MFTPAPTFAPVELATVASWQGSRDEVASPLAPCVPRPEARWRLYTYMTVCSAESARTADNWPKSAGMASPTACSTCRFAV